MSDIPTPSFAHAAARRRGTRLPERVLAIFGLFDDSDHRAPLPPLHRDERRRRERRR